MKEILKQLPLRTDRPRENGLTMVMDKGLSLKQAEDFLTVSQNYIDIIKLGFGTSILTADIVNKIKLYKENGNLVYAGGTLFEAFAIRNQIDDYKRYLNKIGLQMVEISDGSMTIEHDLKCEIKQTFGEFSDVQVCSYGYLNILVCILHRDHDETSLLLCNFVAYQDQVGHFAPRVAPKKANRKFPS